jgi:hypothetical protein
MRVQRIRNPGSGKTVLQIAAESHVEARALADILHALYGIDFDRLTITDAFERAMLKVDGPIHVQARHELDRRLLEVYRTR